MKKLLLLLSVCACTWNLYSQSAIFPDNGTLYDGHLHKINLLMDPDSFEALIADTNRWTDHSYPAVFVYDDTDTLYNVGVRMKGNTSRNSHKLSFKIDVDEFTDQTYQGLKTFNLNGTHNDPSVSREYLCAYLMNADSNSCYRDNPVQLYFNGNLRGIYSNAEQVNKQFLESRFGEKKGNLYKCSWPAELSWLGANQQPYKDLINPSPLNERAYELKTNEKDDDYSDLVTLINVINNTPAAQFDVAIDSIFDVKAYLKVLAAEVLLGHWDNYFYNKNNYFLYHRADGKFVYLPYDMDNTLGVQWGVSNIDSRDIYNWGNRQNSQSPLTYKILAVPGYKQYYESCLRSLCNGVYTESNMFAVTDKIKNVLTAAVTGDPFFNNTVPTDYGYTVMQWEQSYIQAIDDHATFGIRPFISNRRNSALAQLPPASGLKEAETVIFSLYPNPSHGVWTIETVDEANVTVIDLAGRIQFKQQLFKGRFIFEHDLKSGMYLVQVQTATGSAIQKLVIE